MVLERLRELLQQMQPVIEEAVVITEEALSTVGTDVPSGMEHFTVLVSKPFSVLVIGQAVRTRTVEKRKAVQKESRARKKRGDRTQQTHQLNLTFEPKAIASFLTQISNFLSHNPVAVQTLQQIRHTLQPNDAKSQSEFTLRLIEALSVEPRMELPLEPSYPYVSVCQPVEEALRQQVEQEQLLNRVMTQIRQSLELPVILKTAIEEVQQFLQVDRLVIYQFDPPLVSPQSSHSGEKQGQDRGCVTYEAKASEAIPSVLNLVEEFCFAQNLQCQVKYSQAFTLAVEDVETVYILSPCLLRFLRQAKIRAKLVVPVIVQQELWGVLIAHQCFEPRQWQDNEKKFLRCIAEHLAIAISQVKLYAQLQQQKQTLEARVAERTQELHDALLAAQSASRTKSEFLATMSHELRTPLTCVIGMSATLLRWSFGPLSQRQRDYLQTIHDSGEHLLELINDILDLSQVEAGKTILNISEFSLSRLAHQSLKTLREKAYLNQVELELDLQVGESDKPGVPSTDRFVADSRRVKQILLNLLSNAVKFTPEGGKVTLRVRVEQNMAVFQVEDTGIGIPEHQIPLLFQKFQQLDTSYHRKYEGTGLGLALARQLVELHGGWINVSSKVGVGSIFTVRLPAQRLPTASSEMIFPKVSDHLGGRIVLIEDHEDSANIICDMLTVAGYQVIWMIEGSAAVDQVELLQPIALIINMQLPDVDGGEIIQVLRQRASTHHVKVLALFAEAMPEDEQRVAAGADDYLVKPVQPEQLLERIMSLTANVGTQRLSED